jgi:sugar phosphate isomerase/epimerase
VKLGLVTYNLARDWDLDTTIRMCAEHRFAGVELRTTHAHGVEVDLSASERRQVRRRFEDAPVELAGLGSAFEYHSPDRDELRRNVDGTKEYAALAADVGAPGIKVRPNGLQVDDGVPEETTLKQIGEALAECAEYAAGLDVQIRLEVHGRDTSDPRRIRRILDFAGHDNALCCWNSNAGEVVDGSIGANFELLADDIALVHMRDLCAGDYPWLDLLRRLRGISYAGFCLAEIPANEDPGRIMDYYRCLWEAYQTILDLEGAPTDP